MITITLIELLFRGNFSVINLSFLKSLLANCREVRFDSPEITTSIDYDNIVQVLKTHNYSDLVIITNCFEICGKVIPNLFINLGLNDSKLELLFFFDLKDINDNYLEGIDWLVIWSKEFQQTYGFESVLCQIDNGGEQEYFFDSKGLGPMYRELSY